MRIAWFTPLPPIRSGISAYSAELLPRLANRHAIDVYIEVRPGMTRTRTPAPEPPAGTTLRDAHEFVWRHARVVYDLAVYQLGNATCHDYIWPYLHRYPGLVVLHDGQLHHSRARRLLSLGRVEEYRAEFAYDHPETRPEVAEFAVAGFSGAPYYFWPMLRTVVNRARMVAVHNARLAADLRHHYPGTPIESITMGVPETVAPDGTPLDRAAARRAVATRHGLPATAPLLVAYGLVTREKRIHTIIEALELLSTTIPDARLILVGHTVPHFDVRAEARDRGLADRVVVTGFVDQARVAQYLAAADLCLCLRWPSSRETSASWLRCLAAGRPTVVTDLADTIDVPTLDPRAWTVLHASADPPRAGTTPPPVAVSIDILDEAHSLNLALSRLIRDGALRERLGREARAFWARHHTLDRMVDDYDRLLSEAAAAPEPAELAGLPHLSADGTELARSLLAEFDVADDFL